MSTKELVLDFAKKVIDDFSFSEGKTFYTPYKKKYVISDNTVEYILPQSKDYLSGCPKNIRQKIEELRKIKDIVEVEYYSDFEIIYPKFRLRLSHDYLDTENEIKSSILMSVSPFKFLPIFNRFFENVEIQTIKRSYNHIFKIYYTCDEYSITEEITIDEYNSLCELFIKKYNVQIEKDLKYKQPDGEVAKEKVTKEEYFEDLNLQRYKNGEIITKERMEDEEWYYDYYQPFLTIAMGNCSDVNTLYNEAIEFFKEIFKEDLSEENKERFLRWSVLHVERQTQTKNSKLLKNKEAFVNSLSTLFFSWGSDTPQEIIWGANELLNWFESEYNVALNIRFKESPIAGCDNYDDVIETIRKIF
jgi:hypothetical protein